MSSNSAGFFDETFFFGFALVFLGVFLATLFTFFFTAGFFFGFETTFFGFVLAFAFFFKLEEERLFIEQLQRLVLK